MIQYLEDQKGRGAPPLSAIEREELNKLRKQVQVRTSKIEMMQKKVSIQKQMVDSDDESEVLLHCLNLQGEDDVAPMNFEKSKNMAVRSRASVSAEAFGKYNKKEIYKPVVIAKNDTTKEK